MISKTVIMRGREYKCRVVKMHLKLRDQQLKTSTYLTRLLYKNLTVTTKQTIMNNTKNEMKNSLEGINNRISEGEERISDLEDKIVEITTAEQNKQKRMK